LDRVEKRVLVLPMAKELDAWLKTQPDAPDLEESPAGWFKKFSSFTVCGEGECIKTLFTIYVPGECRADAVDLDNWDVPHP